MVTCKLLCPAKTWTAFGYSPASIQHEIAKCRRECQVTRPTPARLQAGKKPRFIR
jgi:hypothetical protein